MEGTRGGIRRSAYVAALWLLVFMFCLRVAGQLIQVLSPVPWLPPLVAWQGSTLHYSQLLLSQIIIIGAMLFIAGRHASGNVQRRPRRGRWLLLAGTIYFLGMAARLIIGLAGWSEAPWFQRPIPAFFHLVLAAYLLVLAAFHLNWLGRGAMNKSPLHYLIYPGVVSLAVVVYGFSLDSGIALPILAFTVVTMGALLIAAFEWLAPYDLNWRPRLRDVWNDLLYTALIQVAVPRLLGFMLAMLLASRIGPDAPLAGLWPRDWPIPAQALLLIVTADFMRYWLHRAAHTVPALWRLHAVHHSPDRLYWLNTSRFHPIEKALQFGLDSLPFILMGVSPEILGFWFVLYSVNGFFQHSNIRLQFGVLSKIFSTAEMHRWHHSNLPPESNSNYANVFILWDRLFGTYYRPLDRSVGRLGLLYASYPMDFGGQMKAPFVNELNR